MRLIKFCKSEHNISNGSSLRVGTLYQYREIENPEIADGDEGKYTFHISFPDKIELDRRWANLLLSNAIGFGKTDDIPRFPGSFSAMIDKLHVVKQSDDTVTVKDTEVTINRESPNCMIFCMSEMEDANHCPFEGYDDNWSFAANRANEFAQRLAELIFSQVKLSNFHNALSAKHTPNSVRDLSLSVRHQRVIYRDRKLVVTPNNRPSFDDLVETILNVPFSKPDYYCTEQEYRFLFELHDRSQTFPPISEYSDLQLNAMGGFV